MLSLAEVGEEALADWKAHVDLGDHVAVEGRVISSKRGELSVMASSLEMASKALRPLPVLHKELSEETRVRQRYADLVVRQEARDMVRTKARPCGRSCAGARRAGLCRGRDARPAAHPRWRGGAPVPTHLNAFDQKMVLRIALELNLKKAVVGGVDRVYEMGRIFRNEGVDATHSPEFTMLEALPGLRRPDDDRRPHPRPLPRRRRRPGITADRDPAGTIDLDGEWRWLPVYDAVSEVVGETVTIDTRWRPCGVCRGPRRRARPGLAAKDKVVPRAALRARRAAPAPADLPVRLPRDRPAAGPAAPRAARA
jgi:lysyl-tRNA synthetase class 2